MNAFEVYSNIRYGEDPWKKFNPRAAHYTLDVIVKRVGLREIKAKIAA